MQTASEAYALSPSTICKILDNKTLSAGARIVAMELHRNEVANGRVSTSKKDLAEKLGFSLRIIGRCLKELITAGVYADEQKNVTGWMQVVSPWGSEQSPPPSLPQKQIQTQASPDSRQQRRPRADYELPA